jgi:hypothetical protein
VVEPVGGADAEEQRHRVRDGAADEIDDLEGKPRAVLEAAAVFVGARVGDRGEEFVEEVAVRVVDLDGVEPGFQGALRGGDEGGFEVLDVGFGHGFGHGEACRVRDRAGGFDVIGPAVGGFAGGVARAEPGGDGAGFAAGVAELDADVLALRVGEFDDPAERFDLAVLPETAVFGGDAAFGLDGRGFHEGDAGATLDYPAKVGEVPVCQVAVPGGVLAEWGELRRGGGQSGLSECREGQYGTDKYSVLKSEPTECDGSEELGDR